MQGLFKGFGICINGGRLGHQSWMGLCPEGGSQENGGSRQDSCPHLRSTGYQRIVTLSHRMWPIIEIMEPESHWRGRKPVSLHPEILSL